MKSYFSLNGVSHLLEIRGKPLNVTSFKSGMVSGVCVCCGKYVKVFRTIVTTNLIDVMDRFVSIKKSANKIFYNKDVLKHETFVRSTMVFSLLSKVSKRRFTNTSFPIIRMFTRLTRSVFRLTPKLFLSLSDSFFSIFTKGSTFLSLLRIPSTSYATKFSSPFSYFARFPKEDGFALQAFAFNFSGFHRLHSIIPFSITQPE